MTERTRRTVVAALLIAAAVPIGEAAQAQGSYQILVSTASDRSSPQPLAGTLSGDIYVFTAPDTGVGRVSFYLDDAPMDLPAYRVERRAPFDLAGTDTVTRTALPFDTSQLGGGTHTVTADLDLGGRRAVITAEFSTANTSPSLQISPAALSLSSTRAPMQAALTVDAAGSVDEAPFILTADVAWLSFDPPAGTTPAVATLTADPSDLSIGRYQGTVTATAAGFAAASMAVTLDVTQNHDLAGATLGDLSDAGPLDGALVAGDLYVFLTPDDHVDQVAYYLDDPSRSGAPLTVTTAAPFHMMGTGVDGLGAAFDTTQLADGAHTLTAEVSRTLGGTQVATATFSVANTGPQVTVSPTQLTFSVVEGESAAATVDVAVTTGAASAFSVLVDRPVRLMPLGDSVTKGEGDPDLNGYRAALFDSLTAAGYPIDFVGGLQNGTGADPDHEGHEGWRAHIADGRSVRDNVYSWLTAAPADFVLLHVGTNDIYDSQPVAEITAEISGILDEIDRYETDTGTAVHVVLAQLINRQDPARPELTTETSSLNGLLADLAAVRIAAGDRMTLVDMESALTYPDDLSDGVHPNATGYAKMAARWLAAVGDLVAGGPRWPSWLSAAPASGATPASVTFTVDSTGLAPGTHTVEVTVAAGAAPAFVLPITLNVTPAAPPVSGLAVSTSADRSGAVPLDGATLAGDVYIFWAPSDSIATVDFWVDDPHMRGRPDKSERHAPFDLAGTVSDGTARPFAVSALGGGGHTVTVRVTATDGSRQDLTAGFTVG